MVPESMAHLVTWQLLTYQKARSIWFTFMVVIKIANYRIIWRFTIPKLDVFQKWRHRPVPGKNGGFIRGYGTKKMVFMVGNTHTDTQRSTGTLCYSNDVFGIFSRMQKLEHPKIQQFHNGWQDMEIRQLFWMARLFLLEGSMVLY